MPFRKQFKRRSQRRRGARRTGRGKSRITPLIRYNPRSAVLPDIMPVRLKYFTGNIGTTTTIGLGTALYKVNSIYDPDGGVGGHQPRGRDQLMGVLYRKYRVFGMSYVVRAHVLTTGQSSLITVGYNQSGQGAPGDMTNAQEARVNKSKIAVPGQPCILKGFIAPWTAQGVTKASYVASDSYAALAGFDPATTPHMWVTWQNADETTSTGHHITVDLTFYCKLSVPLVLGPS